jgi:hypothetical protein
MTASNHAPRERSAIEPGARRPIGASGIDAKPFAIMSTSREHDLKADDQLTSLGSRPPGRACGATGQWISIWIGAYWR